MINRIKLSYQIKLTSSAILKDKRCIRIFITIPRERKRSWKNHVKIWRNHRIESILLREPQKRSWRKRNRKTEHIQGESAKYQIIKIYGFKLLMWLYAIIMSCTYEFKTESTLYSLSECQELLVQSRRHIWSLSHSKKIRTHNHLVANELN